MKHFVNESSDMGFSLEVFPLGGVLNEYQRPTKKEKRAAAGKATGIWEKEGRPDRKDLDHWFRVEAVIRGMAAYDGIADLFEVASACRRKAIT